MPKPPKGITLSDDGLSRCWWCGHDPLYRAYHDDEWGFPVDDDAKLFEKICLEGFQSGLSWLTILRKRENFRRAFVDFDVTRIVRFNARKVDSLLRDEGIVRHRGKIESTINNAKRAIDVAGEFGSLAAYFWRFQPPPSERPRRCNHASLMKMSRTPASECLSKDLKQRGWTFVGPTTAYAFMQAMGLVNDHLEGCVVRERVRLARASFRVPV